MATKTAQVEVWVKVNEAGDYEVGLDAADCGQRFEDNIGTDQETGYRMVKVTLTVPLPVPFELVGEVQCDEQAGELRAA